MPEVDSLPPIEALLVERPPPGTGTPETAGADQAVASPSPARALPHDPATWLPLPEVDSLPPIEALLEGGAGPSGTAVAEPVVSSPSPARALPHDPAAWLPLPEEDSLPSIEALVEEDAARSGDASSSGPRTRTRLARIRPALVGIVVVSTITAGAAFVPGLLGNPVMVKLRVGDARLVSYSTDAPTVAGLLAEHGVSLGRDDRVVPGLGSDLSEGLRVHVRRAFPVLVDLDGDPRTVMTTRTVPEEFLGELDLGNRVVVSVAPATLTGGSAIVLRTRHHGTLIVDGQHAEFDEPVRTVGELLRVYRVVLGPEDTVSPSADELLEDNYTVAVARIATTTETMEEPYEAETVEVKDPDLPVGETVVIREAFPGVANVTYEIVTRGETLIRRVAISRVPIPGREAIGRLVRIGTKADPRWDKLAGCETGGNWAAPGPTWQGGLGIYYRNWSHYGGKAFAPSAGKATREQQIIVGERIRADVGWQAWGCAFTLGYAHRG